MTFKFGEIIASNKDKIDKAVETLIQAERTIADFIEQKFQPKDKKPTSSKADRYDEQAEYESELYDCEAGEEYCGAEEYPLWEDIKEVEEPTGPNWISINDEPPIDKGFVFLRKTDGEEVIGKWQVDADPYSADIEYYAGPDFEWLCELSDVTHWRQLTETEARVLDLPRAIEDLVGLPKEDVFDVHKKSKPKDVNRSKLKNPFKFEDEPNPFT